MKSNIANEEFCGIAPFQMQISYAEIDSKAPSNVYDSHIHQQCEIYINLSGDVSFAVEKSVYPLSPGSIIITRPLEYHHCIYHSNQLHRHFWILFSADGNEQLFDLFYQRESGKHNLLTMPKEKTDELLTVCKQLLDDNQNEADKYYLFFKLINLLNHSTVAEVPLNTNDFIIRAINYINDNLAYDIPIARLAQICNVSVNTLERHFLRTLHLTPSAYIQKKRLAHAVKLLSEGFNVTEAAMYSGFSDCSGFISLFKKVYKTTPLKYKKSITE